MHLRFHGTRAVDDMTAMSSDRRDQPPSGSVTSTPPDRTDVFTLGYQGRSLREVLEIIRTRDVEQVVDVRENGRSRKPGFSSPDLRGALASVGVAYVHLPALGCDRDSRHALWRGAPTAGFLDGYRRKLAKSPGLLTDLTRVVQGTRSLLLCLERDTSRCHRAVLGEWLRAEGCLVQDL